MNIKKFTIKEFFTDFCGVLLKGNRLIGENFYLDNDDNVDFVITTKQTQGWEFIGSSDYIKPKGECLKFKKGKI